MLFSCSTSFQLRHKWTWRSWSSKRILRRLHWFKPHRTGNHKRSRKRHPSICRHQVLHMHDRATLRQRPETIHYSQLRHSWPSDVGPLCIYGSTYYSLRRQWADPWFFFTCGFEWCFVVPVCCYCRFVVLEYKRITKGLI